MTVPHKTVFPYQKIFLETKKIQINQNLEITNMKIIQSFLTSSSNNLTIAKIIPQKRKITQKVKRIEIFKYNHYN